jgi:predicted DNA-binding transcriptional regulator YafY
LSNYKLTDRMSASGLARRLKVDRRSVRRYIALLEELGVRADRGRDAAYMLVAGFKLPPMMFTDDEDLAVSIGPRPRSRARGSVPVDSVSG